ncbi:MAG: hypothetical protein JWN31_919 [Frankiales bacterium]|nr:hypothetical protein [Frankiales bacterium]
MRRKDYERSVAEELRRQGWTYDEISEELVVSKGSLSLWLRSLPRPAPKQRVRMGPTSEQRRAWALASWAPKLAEREIERQTVTGAAAAGVGALTERELELVAVTAYWCEGSKSKPWRLQERVTFINSDPGVIDVFLRWLRAIGVPEENVQPGLSIHESADVDEAHRVWAERIGIPVERFSAPTLKRHNPRTVRKNTGDDYYGCLVIRVRQGRLLYQRIAGAWQGIVEASTDNSIPGRLGARHRTLNP